jgi:hypothetical protein
MKFWEKFLRNIFRLAAQPRLKKMQPRLIEAVLARSASMLDPQMIAEIKSFILSQQTKSGGFADRSGKSDLYYSLFGYLLAEAYSVGDVIQPLKKYIASVAASNQLSGVHLFCGAILHAKLIGQDDTSDKLRRQIVDELTKTDLKQPEYAGFLGILALYYLEDYRSIQKVVSRYKQLNASDQHPCPVVAASAILLGMTGDKSQRAVNILRSFYRETGGFAALHRAPGEDLLSTGVALFALQFLDEDLRLIKPECLIFVDGLYDQGGFRATSSDLITDVEYTFYGLLALGSMA